MYINMIHVRGHRRGMGSLYIIQVRAIVGIHAAALIVLGGVHRSTLGHGGGGCETFYLVRPIAKPGFLRGPDRSSIHICVYIMFMCVCVCTRYVILNVFNIYTYAFNMCVCVLCVYPPPSAYTHGNRHLYYFYDLYTHTHRHSRIKYILYCTLFFQTIILFNSKRSYSSIYTLLCWTNKIELPLDER